MLPPRRSALCAARLGRGGRRRWQCQTAGRAAGKNEASVVAVAFGRCMCVRGGVVATDDSRINTTGPLLIKHQVAILEQPGESCLPDDVYSGGLHGRAAAVLWK